MPVLVDGLFAKDESHRPTGSVKHGFARSLFPDGLTRGLITEDTPLVDAAGGNIAVAEAYFARLLGLPFTAVVPARTSAAKRARIEQHGEVCVAVDPPLAVYDRARELAAGGHYLDHLARLGPAVDAHEPADLVTEILHEVPEPAWIVLGVGTGASSHVVGRHLRRRGATTRVAVVDPENSAYFPGWVTDSPDYGTGMPSRVQGIGRPQIEPAVVDLVIPVPDAVGIAAMRHLAAAGLRAGPSTSAALRGACHLLHRMRDEGTPGPVVLVAADSGTPYATTYYDDEWVSAKGLDPSPHAAVLEHFTRTGDWRA
ncbi:pyridoxal-phosphate dependent enzyme [Actinosynnema sp. NPDC047251]|uniref:Pyridoxal-5'-phosphate-dependent protein, beta subunit n=1 Tax=Saccharothrix espanaensis (strain ATCC 51144 / DSM 44229 / JCM 9112 / NBRC 15066 / NRRL 15764) TaxID=1179773 RepID=K0K398_SACES|nr:pyridoxal-phosphate dependent enzyme [Saccharothrix espanaensis]CCH31364.1 Pyridoxal-5'-phosphate-dependent protein, beta subunit [Saccharothrix espanaensis DSM 44229]